MKTKIIGTNYAIEEVGTSKGRVLTIGVNVDSGGGVTVINNRGDEEFTFINSKPEMLIKLGKMLTQAGKIALQDNERLQSVKRTYKKRVVLENKAFYCIKCRAKKMTNKYQTVTMKNGRNAYRAVDDCGTTMFKIGGL